MHLKQALMHAYIVDACSVCARRPARSDRQPAIYDVAGRGGGGYVSSMSLLCRFYVASSSPSTMLCTKSAITSFTRGYTTSCTLILLLALLLGADIFRVLDNTVHKIRKFASMFNVHVTLVIHPRKDDESHLLVQKYLLSWSESTNTD